MNQQYQQSQYSNTQYQYQPREIYNRQTQQPFSIPNAQANQSPYSKQLYSGAQDQQNQQQQQYQQQHYSQQQQANTQINYKKNLYEEFQNQNNEREQIQDQRMGGRQNHQLPPRQANSSQSIISQHSMKSNMNNAQNTNYDQQQQYSNNLNMMTYQPQTSRSRGFGVVNDDEEKGYQQIKTMQPRQPDHKKLEVTVNNYTPKDIQNAQRDLKSLKEKLLHKKIMQTQVSKNSRQGMQSQKSLRSENTMSSENKSSSTTYNRQDSTNARALNNQNKLNQKDSSSSVQGSNQNYRKAFNPNNYQATKTYSDDEVEDEYHSSTHYKPQKQQPQRQTLKDQTNSPIAKASGKPNIPAFMQAQASNLEECPSCGRKFNENAYEKHVKICKDVFIKKRKAYDMKEKRIVDDDQIEFLKKAEKKDKQQTSKTQGKNPKAAQDQAISGTGAKLPKWKMMSLQFRQAIGSSKPADEYSGAINSAAAQAYEDPSYKKCPGCERKFNETAAARHIPICLQKAKENAIKNRGKPAANQNQTTMGGQTSKSSVVSTKGFGQTQNSNSHLSSTAKPGGFKKNYY